MELRRAHPDSGKHIEEGSNAGESRPRPLPPVGIALFGIGRRQFARLVHDAEKFFAPGPRSPQGVGLSQEDTSSQCKSVTVVSYGSLHVSLELCDALRAELCVPVEATERALVVSAPVGGRQDQRRVLIGRQDRDVSIDRLKPGHIRAGRVCIECGRGGEHLGKRGIGCRSAGRSQIRFRPLNSQCVGHSPHARCRVVDAAVDFGTVQYASLQTAALFARVRRSSSIRPDRPRRHWT